MPNGNGSGGLEGYKYLLINLYKYVICSLLLLKKISFKQLNMVLLFCTLILKAEASQIRHFLVFYCQLHAS